jgi:hypothetical protein
MFKQINIIIIFIISNTYFNSLLFLLIIILLNFIKLYALINYKLKKNKIL